MRNAGIGTGTAAGIAAKTVYKLYFVARLLLFTVQPFIFSQTIQWVSWQRPSRNGRRN